MRSPSVPICGRWRPVFGWKAEQRSPPNGPGDGNVDQDGICAVSAVIVLSTAVTASAAPKKQKAPRSGPQAQAIAPRAAPPINPYSPAATGGGSPGYNQMLERY